MSLRGVWLGRKSVTGSHSLVIVLNYLARPAKRRAGKAPEKLTRRKGVQSLAALVYASCLCLVGHEERYCNVFYLATLGVLDRVFLRVDVFMVQIRDGG